MKEYFLQFMKHMQYNPLPCRTKSLAGFFCLFWIFLVVIHSITKEEQFHLVGL